MPNCASKKEIEHAKGVDTSNLATKADLISLKAEINKLEFDKSVVKVETILNDLKTKMDNLGVDKSKTAPMNLKELVI